MIKIESEQLRIEDDYSVNAQLNRSRFKSNVLAHLISSK